jgi:hypothetical protein
MTNDRLYVSPQRLEILELRREVLALGWDAAAEALRMASEHLWNGDQKAAEKMLGVAKRYMDSAQESAREETE